VSRPSTAEWGVTEADPDDAEVVRLGVLGA
jgi:hypothetical protein